ncbi:MAG: hypothetical protein UZ15_CFX003001529 [Chloroflexi bacterium OLB15]|nr:MAG: hypothetical protein UZ15_CFX003001529 [Chloroflexi bacterium OLB15]
MRSVKVLAILAFLLCVAGQAKAQTTEIIAPNVFLQGLVLPTGVRYTATFIKPDEAQPLRNVSVEITLPPGAQFSQMLVPPQVEFDVVRVSREGAITMIWQTSRVPGEDMLDSYSFTLAQPLTADTEFYIEWQDENGAQQFESFFELPPLALATQNTGIVTLTQDGFLPAGETGVQVSVPQQPEPVTLTVNVLPADFNPPPEYGALWWCSLIEITGLPDGVSATVIVPLRRPIAPFTALSLFRQNGDGSWSPLEGEAFVTADGQYVTYEHPGGVVATGGPQDIQPELIPAANIQAITDAGLTTPVNVTPDLTSITDGTSNTILVNEIPAPPAITDGTSNITDGTSNTVVFSGQLPPTPTTEGAINDLTDGSSNTILVGEATPIPALPSPTIVAAINDGSSNTILVGEATPVQPTSTIAPSPTPNLPRVVAYNPEPRPRGNIAAQIREPNTPRIEIYTQVSIAPVQCQTGRINCVLLIRRVGGGFR